MHDFVFYSVIIWQFTLAAMLGLFVLRTRNIVTRALALDMLSLIVVSGVTAVGIHRDEAGYLDVALVLAMISFVQTVATARLAERRKDFQ